MVDGGSQCSVMLFYEQLDSLKIKHRTKLIAAGNNKVNTYGRKKVEN